MGDATRQSANRFDLLHLPQLLLQFAALSNVLHGPLKIKDPSL